MNYLRFRGFVLKNYFNKEGKLSYFASDLKWDDEHPNFKTKREWEEYFDRICACSGAMECFEILWKEYEEYLKQWKLKKKSKKS